MHNLVLPHAISAHGYCITDSNSVEAQSHQTDLVAAFLDLACQVMQMHVAGVALPPNGRNADLCNANHLPGSTMTAGTFIVTHEATIYRTQTRLVATSYLRLVHVSFRHAGGI